MRWLLSLPLIEIASLAIVVVTVRHAELSFSYLARAVLIGLTAGILITAYRQWSNRPGWLVFALLLLALIYGGYRWSKDQTFGMAEGEIWSWRLALQFSAAMLLALFSVIEFQAYRAARKQN
jgi:hypothetical protein